MSHPHHLCSKNRNSISHSLALIHHGLTVRTQLGRAHRRRGEERIGGSLGCCLHNAPCSCECAVPLIDFTMIIHYCTLPRVELWSDFVAAAKGAFFFKPNLFSKPMKSGG